MRLINCTPHAIAIHPVDDDPIVLPPSGMVARLVGGPTPDVRSIVTGGATIRVAPPQSYDGIEGVPDTDSAIAIVVSAMVGAQAPTLLGGKWQGRVFGPDTGADAVRNEKGQIVGVRGLILYW